MPVINNLLDNTRSFSVYFRYMYEEVGELIETAVHFKSGRADPLAFRWQNSLFKVDKINLCHKARLGNNLIYSYSLSTASGDNFKISFNPNTLSWTLDQIYD